MEPDWLLFHFDESVELSLKSSVKVSILGAAGEGETEELGDNEALGLRELLGLREADGEAEPDGDSDADGELDAEGDRLAEGDTTMGTYSTSNHMAVTCAVAVGVLSISRPIWAVSRSALVQAVVLLPGRL